MRPSIKRSKVVTLKADEQKLLGFKGRHNYLVTAPSNKAEWRINVIYIEDRPHTNDDRPHNDGDKSLKPVYAPDESCDQHSDPEPFAEPRGQSRKSLKLVLTPDESSDQHSEPEPFAESGGRVESQPVPVPDKSCDQHSDLEPFTELGEYSTAETQLKVPQMTNDEQSTNNEHEASGLSSVYGSESSVSDLSTIHTS
jgi:hypothetical protein